MTDQNSTASSPARKGGSAAVGVVVVAVVGLAALLVAPSLAPGLNGGGESATSSAGQNVSGPSSVAPTGEATQVTVTVAGMAFVPSVIEVPVGNTLEVTFDNTGDQLHDLRFANGAEVGPLSPGASETVNVGVIGADMDGWCTLPGHRQMGMELTVVAVGGEASNTGEPGDAAAEGSPDGSVGGSLGDSGDHSSHGTSGASGATTASAINMASLMAEAENSEAYPAALQPLPSSTTPQTREYTFEVTEDEDNLTESIIRPLWTFNGTSPGPTLRGSVGDEFVITLVNNGTMGHSIDFHAGETAPDFAMRTIQPGEQLEYRFTAGRSGIWMYHCSTMPMSLHIANGMFGAVIIDPPGLGPVDREYVLIQSEFYSDLGDPNGSRVGERMSVLAPDVVMFNGRAFQYAAHPLTARVGERIRFWVLDVGPNSPLAFHIVGTQFDTWWSEGHYGVYRGHSTDGITQGVTGAQVLPLQPAQGGFVELVVDQPGNYAIVNHIMSLAEKGASGTLQVQE